MVLTDEVEQKLYLATLETEHLDNEIQVFSDLTTNPKPQTFDAVVENGTVQKLKGSGTQTVSGAGLLLKVMAGDRINAAVFAKYNNQEISNQPTTNEGIAQQLASAMNQAFANQYGLHSDALTEISADNWASGILSFLNTKTEETGNMDGSEAHINWVMLDEEMLRFVPGSSGFQRVPQMLPSDPAILVQAEGGEDIEILKSGYIYVFVSNSANIPMFFDDLRVAHIPGPLVEETHYYPFGLVMKGISSKSMNGVMSNKYSYNGKEEQNNEFSDGAGLDWLDYGARMYDGQIGRFFTQDRFSEKFYFTSPYQYVLGNPISRIDVNGDSSVVVTSSSIRHSFKQSGVNSGNDQITQTFATTITVYDDETGKFVYSATTVTCVTTIIDENGKVGPITSGSTIYLNYGDGKGGAKIDGGEKTIELKNTSSEYQSLVGATSQFKKGNSGKSPIQQLAEERKATKKILNRVAAGVGVAAAFSKNPYVGVAATVFGTTVWLIDENWQDDANQIGIYKSFQPRKRTVPNGSVIIPITNNIK